MEGSSDGAGAGDGLLSGDPDGERDAELFRRAGELFDATLDIPEGQRTAWLAGRAGDDAALRAEVERLLAAHARPGGVLDPPPFVAPEDVADALWGALSRRDEIVRELGRGGMSIVFLAWSASTTAGWSSRS